MILVTMGHQYAAQLVRVLFNVCHVRYNKIYARHIVIGEYKPAVYYYHVLAVFQHGHVLAYFAHAAKRDYLQLVLCAARARALRLRRCLCGCFCHAARLFGGGLFGCLCAALCARPRCAAPACAGLRARFGFSSGSSARLLFGRHFNVIRQKLSSLSYLSIYLYSYIIL